MQGSSDRVSPVRDIWDKIQVVAITLGAIALPIVVAFIGNGFSSSIKEKEIRLKTVEIAVNILSQDPKSNTSLPSLRDWAIDVVNNYSGIPLSNQARQELLKNPLPSQEAERVSELLGSSFGGEGGGFFIESMVESYKFMDGNYDLTKSTKIATARRPIIGQSGIHEFKVIIDGRKFDIAVPLKKGFLTKIIIEKDGVSIKGPLEINSFFED